MTYSLALIDIKTPYKALVRNQNIIQTTKRQFSETELAVKKMRENLLIIKRGTTRQCGRKLLLVNKRCGKKLNYLKNQQNIRIETSKLILGI